MSNHDRYKKFHLTLTDCVTLLCVIKNVCDHTVADNMRTDYLRECMCV